MLIFITPIRHPYNSNDYGKVEELLKRTLKSVCRQTDEGFRVIVVCNQVPEFHEEFEKVDFLKVEFEPPKRVDGGVKPAKQDVFKDMGTKFVAGILYAKRKYSPDYIMFFDGDDLVSNRVAAYVNSFPSENGWYVDQGYVYEDGMINMKLKEDFYLTCGTSHIPSAKLLDIPDELPNNPSQEDILKHPVSKKLSEVIGRHVVTKAYFDEKGLPLQPLPFPAAIWMINHGENDSVRKGLLAIIGSPVSQENREEFMIETKSFSILDYVNYYLRWPRAVLISLRLLIFRDAYNAVRRHLKKMLLYIRRAET